jgi:hypothetical protein
MSSQKKSIRAKIVRQARRRFQDYIRSKQRECMILNYVYCMQGGFEEFDGSNLREMGSFR